MDIKRIDGSIIWSGDAATVKEAIDMIVKARICLQYADLQSADLRSADLQYANLQNANLQYADLQSANLRSADLQYANLQNADLQSANLRSADLQYANLRNANLQSANLRSADLQYANLRNADLRSADLQYADLQNADLQQIQIARFRIVPTGDVVGWKKCCYGVLVKLLVPESAKRSNAPSGRKCRAEFVKVLEVVGGNVGISMHDGVTKYVVGETVRCDKFSEDWWVECDGGIHFFITREEAEAYE